MRVDVDRTRHDDFPARVVALVGTRPVRRRIDNAAIAHPHIADRVAPMRGIDDAPMCDASQHGQGPGFGSTAAICAITSATDGNALAWVAARATIMPLLVSCSTQSWS